MKRSVLSLTALACLLAAPAARADADPVVVDPQHYKVEFENDAVRVLRIKYGPGEESVMHSHPNAVAIFLTEIEVAMTMPDGTTEVTTGKAGEVKETPASVHLPRNAGTKPMELILVELKSKDPGKK
ncbi:MAG TPA: hypothetical protein VGD81_00575 [Opitutaceae bacterium]